MIPNTVNYRKSGTPNPLTFKRSNASEFRHGKIRHITKDFKSIYGIPEEITAKILMARGVYKAFSLRREMFAFDLALKEEITSLQMMIFTKKIRRGSRFHQQTIGRMKAIEEIRKFLRELQLGQQWAFFHEGSDPLTRSKHAEVRQDHRRSTKKDDAEGSTRRRDFESFGLQTNFGT